MDLVVIPTALMTFYGSVVLGCGGVLGFIIGRNLRRAEPPEPSHHLGRRMGVLEAELELAQAELQALRDEREFFRRLMSHREKDSGDRQMSAA